ncbi:phosphate ABC transporter substrate-binding protein [Paenibacillus crassostreae]|uniref:Phosphate-binding protein n=1 Tax=Paenibacillus crassostreae TaxID=1763538 RepID=A0A167FYR9_9BACL|nr:phosphate ABC transporter substrate-binding protein [Paenibacillus crassostreae]AOZ93936.1 phosphate-binding protein [Paenibacillus crassostreae]OAB77032.1 phosphate-binding protein [Paenibacillus crassostreae]
MRLRKPFLLLGSFALVIALAACGTNNATNNGANQGAANTTETETETKTEALTGSILAVGSTALQPLVEQVGQKFMAEEEYSKIAVQVQGGGSGTGLTQVSGGQADIGNSDVFAEEKLKDADADKAKELVDHQVAVVAMATVANKEIGVDNLTKQQLIDIFSGKITNWSEIGGADQKIVIVNRPSSSGTRSTFEKYAMGTKVDDIEGSILEESSGNVRKIVSETPGAIGYLALSYLDDSIKTVQYEGVEATVENVTAGTYPVWAYEHMYTKGEPNEVVKAFLDYMVSDEVQKADVVELGYIPASDMKVSRDVDGNITNK